MSAPSKYGWGLYAALLELEERRVARHPDFTAEDGAVFRYPRFRLERLRAGLPVQVERWRLPVWAARLKDGPPNEMVTVHPED